MDHALLTCPVCLELATEPRETGCCHQLFCHSCIKPQKKCPVCQNESLTHHQNVLVARILDSFPAVCPYDCGTTITRGNLEEHIKLCDERPLECPKSTCANLIFRNRKTFLAHITSIHPSETVEAFQLFLKKPPNKNSPLVETRQDVIANRRNALGSLARLGKTGKYYCGRRFIETHGCCQRCDGICGLPDGCNCPNCMKLDLEARRLPTGYLVNRSGFPARKSELGIFYCGRKVLDGIPMCDGYCGPDDGPNCNDCKTLDRQAKSLYASIR